MAVKAGSIVGLCVILFYSDRYIAEGSSCCIVWAGTNRIHFGKLASTQNSTKCRFTLVAIFGEAEKKRISHATDIFFNVDKKNQLDVTFCILYFSSNSCSTCFGQPCAHHQELTTHYLPTGLDNLPAATAHTNTRL